MGKLLVGNVSMNINLHIEVFVLFELERMIRQSWECVIIIKPMVSL